MLARFFPPGGLDPVLDGGKGDEDSVIAPEVPTGGLVGQSVLGDQSDGQILDSAGVVALGQGQVGQVGGEVEVAAGAVMPREADDQVDGASGAAVAQVVQSARGAGVASRTAAAVRAKAGGVVAAAPFDAGLGQVLDAADALGGVGDVFSWSEHGPSLLANAPLSSFYACSDLIRLTRPAKVSNLWWSCRCCLTRSTEKRTSFSRPLGKGAGAACAVATNAIDSRQIMTRMAKASGIVGVCYLCGPGQGNRWPLACDIAVTTAPSPPETSPSP